MSALQEKLNGLTVLETAPLLFTGILDEAIKENFTLYLLQESETKFKIYAPTFYNDDVVRIDSNRYPRSYDFDMPFETLEEAKEQFDDIIAHLGEPLDLRDLDGGFLLMDFGLDDDIYSGQPSLLPRYESFLVRYSLDENIFFRIVNIENLIVINKRMSIEYETNEAALSTYMAIVKYFKEIEEMNLMGVSETTSNLIDDDEETVHRMLNQLVSTNFDNLRELKIKRNDEGNCSDLRLIIHNGNLRISIHYLNGIVTWGAVQVFDTVKDRQLVEKSQISSLGAFMEAVNEVLPHLGN